MYRPGRPERLSAEVRWGDLYEEGGCRIRSPVGRIAEETGNINM